jgi:hypothetical protein
MHDQVRLDGLLQQAADLRARSARARARADRVMADSRQLVAEISGLYVVYEQTGHVPSRPAGSPDRFSG